MAENERQPADVDPRFKLANERTFLAWSRTALAFVAAGLAITQLLRQFELPYGRRLLGIPLIVAGAAVAVLASKRREAVDRALERNEDLPASTLPALVTAVIVGSAAVAVALAMSGTPLTR